MTTLSAIKSAEFFGKKAKMQNQQFKLENKP